MSYSKVSLNNVVALGAGGESVDNIFYTLSIHQ
jgi:hypothetical protein